MRIVKGRAFRVIAGFMVLFVSFILSRWLAPLVTERVSLNPFNFLSWGAPAIFHEDVDVTSSMLKLEPWRLLGLQLPAVAGIRPTDWVEVTVPPEPAEPGVFNPEPPLFDVGTVAIYHTHASEAFVPSCGEARSTDFSQTVVRLGATIEEILTAQGISVLHNEDYHDREYNKSYINSRKTALQMLNQEPDTILLLDIHRDGVGTTSVSGRAATTCTIQGKQAGQIMFVVSTAHENWQKNFRVANDLHNLLEDKYPGLSRGILSRANSTFHQDLHSGAVLIELGGHWNTLGEAIYGAELLADVLADYCRGGS